MDGVDWGSLAEWAAVLAAVALAVWSSWRAGRAARKAAEAQTRSTRALEFAAAAQSRLAELAEAEAQRYEPPWQIIRYSDTRHQLLNDGDEIAYGVAIVGAGVQHADWAESQWEQIGPREARDFFVVRSDALTVR